MSKWEPDDIIVLAVIGGIFLLLMTVAVGVTLSEIVK